MTENAWDQFVEVCQHGSEQVKKELKEVDMLIQQTSVEVDRIMQTNSRAVVRARQIESSFDTTPREDIKSAYDSLIENQRRLFTMRGQLEKLQSDQKNLTRLAELYQTVLEHTAPEEIDVAEAIGADRPTAPQAMVVSIIEAQEQERLRLSRQMHDGPAQSLTNFILQAEICQRLFDRNPDRAAEELNNLKSVASSTFQKVRDFIFDLRPMMLDDLGLIPTLRRYVDSYNEKSGIRTVLHILGDERRLEPHREVILFRSIQELLANAREHSRATQATITLDLGLDFVSAIVEDNGQGFNPDTVLSGEDSTVPESKAASLKTLRERVELIGGVMRLESEEGHGSKITVRIPAGNPVQPG